MISGTEDLLSRNNILESVTCNNLFSVEECNNIIRETQGSEINNATIGTHGEINNNIRETKVKFLNLNNHNMWIGKRIIPVIEDINNVRYKFKLTRLKELHLLEYTKDCFYDWHIDLSGNLETSSRKLSFVVFLSNPKDYDGGNLDFDMKDKSRTPFVPMEQGSMIIFPSFLPHRVLPVTRGVRHTLVGWIHGPSFQ